MEYVFGRDNERGVETLRTKGAAHTDLQGFQEVVREFDDCTITDSFRVVRHCKAAEDVAGNCYDWYEIDCHNRMIDRTKPVIADLDALIVSTLEG